jgi:hypothetical protein
LVDGVAVFSIRSWGIYVTEALVVIFGLVSIGIIFTLREDEPVEESPEPIMEDQGVIAQPDLPPIVENHENIDQTRYAE